MAVTRSLYELHLLDVDIRERERELAEVMRRLEDEEALSLAQRRARDEEEKLLGLERQQREADATISDIQAKLIPLEKRAYSGSVTNPRELEGLGQEAIILKKRLGEAEDRSLLLMDDVEAVEKVLAAAKEELASIEEQRREDVKTLSGEKSRIEAELSQLRSKRKTVVSSIDAGTIRLYESLRSSRTGTAVAKVERGMCQGCRIALPVGVIQQARLGRKVVRCTSCGMILFVS